MPWKIEDVDEHKQGLDDKQKEQWVAIANSAHQKCMDDGGKEEMCAMHAIMQANGVVGESRKKMDNEEEFHLPGQHDQSTHGKGGGVNLYVPGELKPADPKGIALSRKQALGDLSDLHFIKPGLKHTPGPPMSESLMKNIRDPMKKSGYSEIKEGVFAKEYESADGGKAMDVLNIKYKSDTGTFANAHSVVWRHMIGRDASPDSLKLVKGGSGLADLELYAKRAEYAWDNKEELFNIDSVEIFRTGTWRGDKYTTTDLQHMVDSFNEFKSAWFRPAIKDGHHTDKGKPALGYMENVRIQGEKLLADLVELPKKVYDAIRMKRYDRVSVEMYHNMQREGKTYPKVLTALAILGVEVPEVSGLKPLRECFEDQQGILVAYEIEFEQKSERGSDDNQKKEDLEMDAKELEAVKKEYETKMEAMSDQLNSLQGKLKEYEKKQTPAEVKTLVEQLSETQQKFSEMSAKLDDMQKKNLSLEEARRKDRIQQKVDSLKVPAFRFYAQQFYDWATADAEVKIVKYSMDGITKEATAEQIVDQFCAQLNKATDNLLIQHSKVDVFKRDDAPADDNPRVEADRRIKAFMAEHPDADYSTAMTKVFEADGDLKLAYARS